MTTPPSFLQKPSIKRFRGLFDSGSYQIGELSDIFLVLFKYERSKNGLILSLFYDVFFDYFTVNQQKIELSFAP